MHVNRLINQRHFFNYRCFIRLNSLFSYEWIILLHIYIHKSIFTIRPWRFFSKSDSVFHLLLYFGRNRFDFFSGKDVVISNGISYQVDRSFGFVFFFFLAGSGLLWVRDGVTVGAVSPKCQEAWTMAASSAFSGCGYCLMSIFHIHRIYRKRRQAVSL